MGLDGEYGMRKRFRNKLNEFSLGLVPLEVSGRHAGRSGHLILGPKKLQPRGRVTVRNRAVNRCGNITQRTSGKKKT